MKVHCSVYFINGFESAALINHFCWSKSQTWFISNSRNHYCHTAVLLLVSSSFSHLENEGYKTSNTDLYEVMLGTNDLKCFLGIWFCCLILSNSGEIKTKQNRGISQKFFSLTLRFYLKHLTLEFGLPCLNDKSCDHHYRQVGTLSSRHEKVYKGRSTHILPAFTLAFKTKPIIKVFKPNNWQ